MPFWEADKRRSARLDDETKAIIKRIWSRFHVDVIPHVSMTAAEMLKLYSALEKICRYYGIDSIPYSQEPLRIILKKKVWGSDSPFHFRDHPIDGLFEYGTNSIHLPADHPGALVHELIHAIDYAFRNPSMDRCLTFIDDFGKDAFVRFLKKRGTGENDILDFKDAYERMQSNLSEYLKTPSEIIARMGAYSFWSDNAEACEDNPFLRFSYAPYTEVNRKTGSIRTIDQFPFHSIDAIRLFVHHASRDIAREKPARWHLSSSGELVAAHSSEWYRKAWYRLDDLDYPVRDATRIINENGMAIRENPRMLPEEREKYETAIMRAKEILPQAMKDRSEFVSFLAESVVTPELQDRAMSIRKEDRLHLLSSYLKECQSVAAAREIETEKAPQRQSEMER